MTVDRFTLPVGTAPTRLGAVRFVIADPFAAGYAPDWNTGTLDELTPSGDVLVPLPLSAAEVTTPVETPTLVKPAPLPTKYPAVIVPETLPAAPLTEPVWVVAETETANAIRNNAIKAFMADLTDNHTLR